MKQGKRVLVRRANRIGVVHLSAIKIAGELHRLGEFIHGKMSIRRFRNSWPPIAPKKFLTNQGENTLSERLEKILPLMQDFDCLVGYFFIMIASPPSTNAPAPDLKVIPLNVVPAPKSCCSPAPQSRRKRAHRPDSAQGRRPSSAR